MRKSLARFYPAVCLLAAFYSHSPVHAEAPDIGAHFEGKTITILHGSSPGGGYDIIARAVALLAPEYLPAKPARILVQSRPGGGPFRLNSLRPLVKAKPDGLTIGYAYSAWILADTIGEGPPGYQLSDLKPLGTPLGGYSDNVYCANPEVASSWEDIEKLGRPITWGGIAPGVGAHLIAVPWLKELGAPVKPVWGYGGSTEMTAAFRRGELEFASSCNTSLVRDYPKWAKRGNVAPIFWIGEATAAGDKTLQKMGLTRPPHIYEAATKYITADWQKQAFEVGLTFARLSNVFFVPAGVPKEVLAVWREAFREVVDDPRFAQKLPPDAERQRLFPMYAEEVETILDAAKGLSPKALNLLTTLVTGQRR